MAVSYFREHHAEPSAALMIPILGAMLFFEIQIYVSLFSCEEDIIPQIHSSVAGPGAACSGLMQEQLNCVSLLEDLHRRVGRNCDAVIKSMNRHLPSIHA